MKDKKHVVILEDSVNIAKNIEQDLKTIYPEATFLHFRYPCEGISYISSKILNGDISNESEWLIITGMEMRYSSYDGLDPKAGEVVLKNLRLGKRDMDVIVVSPRELNLSDMKTIYRNVIGVVKSKSLFDENDCDMISQYKAFLN